jgi:metal-responsive CopG/Arc/MetJ family transcriptional regulator
MSFGLGTKRKGKRANWTISIDEDLATRINLLCVDPSVKKPTYGFRSQLIEDLLRQWAREKEQLISNVTKELVA